jgi:hypothetical protein
MSAIGATSPVACAKLGDIPLPATLKVSSSMSSERRLSLRNQAVLHHFVSE